MTVTEWAAWLLGFGMGIVLTLAAVLWKANRMRRS